MRFARLAGALGLGALACAAVLFITRAPGPGLDPDSMSYAGAGELLARTGRLRIPDADWWSADSTEALAQFPPGFSIVIAGTMHLFRPPVQAARVVEAIAALVLVVTVVLLLDQTAGPPAGPIAVLLLAATPALFDNYIRVLSEPLFVACMALALAAMVRRPDRPLLAGLAAAASELVRYAGVSVAIAAVLWAFGTTGTWRIRLERALEAALPVVALRTWWAVRLHAVGVAAPGVSHVQRGLAGAFRDGAITVRDWLTPSVPGEWLRALLALAIVSSGTWLLRRTWRRMPRDARATARRRLFNAAGLLALCYAIVLIFSRAFVGGGIPFDERLLSPLFLLTTVVLAAALRIRWPAWSGAVRTSAALAVMAWTAGGIVLNAEQLGGLQEDGWGYSGTKWQPSREQEWLRTEGSHFAIFSNNPMLVYFLTGRPSRELPDTSDSGTLEDFAGTLEEQHGAVVAFDEDYRRMDPPAFLAAVLGLREVTRLPHMTAWVQKERSTP
ncbi:MAG: glycosyltransferase family 39 protein [Gemmatimonadota bacterium]